MRVEAAIRDAVALINDVRISSIAKRSASALARHVLVDNLVQLCRHFEGGHRLEST